jgi:branched-chain amino acid transport system permease protein
MMVAPIVYLDPGMMTSVFLYASAGAVLGGVDNPFGAVMGGFILGVLENVAGAFLIGTELKLTVALVVMVVTLIVKPTGLLGRVVVTRV